MRFLLCRPRRLVCVTSEARQGAWRSQNVTTDLAGIGVALSSVYCVRLWVSRCWQWTGGECASGSAQIVSMPSVRPQLLRKMPKPLSRKKHRTTAKWKKEGPGNAQGIGCPRKANSRQGGKRDKRIESIERKANDLNAKETDLATAKRDWPRRASESTRLSANKWSSSEAISG